MNDNHRYELEKMKEIVRREGVRSYLEIGARFGISLRAIAETMEPGRIVVVDLPGGPWGAKGSQVPLEKLCEELRRKHEVYLFIGRSDDLKIWESVAGLAPFDLVYIDADHAYEAVQHDFGSYGPMGRIVIFDDIFAEGTGVVQLWDELKGRYRSEALFSPALPKMQGKGVLYVGEGRIDASVGIGGEARPADDQDGGGVGSEPSGTLRVGEGQADPE